MREIDCTEEELTLCKEISRRLMERGHMEWSKEAVFERGVIGFVFKTWVLVGKRRMWATSYPATWLDALKARLGLKHERAEVWVQVRSTPTGEVVNVWGMREVSKEEMIDLTGEEE